MSINPVRWTARPPLGVAVLLRGMVGLLLGVTMPRLGVGVAPIGKGVGWAPLTPGVWAPARVASGALTSIPSAAITTTVRKGRMIVAPS